MLYINIYSGEIFTYNIFDDRYFPALPCPALSCCYKDQTEFSFLMSKLNCLRFACIQRVTNTLHPEQNIGLILIKPKTIPSR